MPEKQKSKSMSQNFSLITLNIWGGHVSKPLTDFIKSNSHTDIICLQEVYNNASAKITNEDRYLNLNAFSEILTLLPEHKGYFRPVVNGVYGIGMLIHNNLQALEEGEKDIYVNDNYPGMGPTHSRILQYARIKSQLGEFTVVNIHGLWNGRGKTDSDDRILQSKNIKNFLNNINTPTIACGDFNLRPDTESFAIIANGMNDHIKLNDITCTRTSLYPGVERYADYILTSNDVNVRKFKIMPDEVSDHSPLFLQFSL